MKTENSETLKTQIGAVIVRSEEITEKGGKHTLRLDSSTVSLRTSTESFGGPCNNPTGNRRQRQHRAKRLLELAS